MKKKKQRKPVRPLVSMLTLTSEIIVSGLTASAGVYVLHQDSVDYVCTVYASSETLENESGKENENLYLQMKKNYEQVKKVNADCAGWIDVPGIANYPVMYSGDNTKYLHLDADGESYWFAGCLFMDENTGGSFHDNATIYGHHMLNGTMFAGLRKYQNEQYFQTSRCITVYDGEYFFIYKPYYAGVLPGEEANVQQTGFTDEASRNACFQAWADSSRCAMEKGLSPSFQTQNLYLYTCEYGYSFDRPKGLVGAGCIQVLQYKNGKFKKTKVSVPYGAEAPDKVSEGLEDINGR